LGQLKALIFYFSTVRGRNVNLVYTLGEGAKVKNPNNLKKRRKNKKNYEKHKFTQNYD
jgi:hypothetical protein